MEHASRKFVYEWIHFHTLSEGNDGDNNKWEAHNWVVRRLSFMIMCGIVELLVCRQSFTIMCQDS